MYKDKRVSENNSILRYGNFTFTLLGTYQINDQNLLKLVMLFNKVDNIIEFI